jgi:NTE family protein
MAVAPHAAAELGRADAVFEGGGVKGIAFAGALKAAEQAGTREWVNVAGTSAGSIVAALLVAGYDADGLRDILQRKTTYSKFADYGPLGRYLGGFLNQFRIRGYVPGRYFVSWLRERFQESKLGKPDPTFADVVRDDLPAGLSEAERESARFRLRVIASDISGGRMLVLPDDIELYQDERGRSYVKDEFKLVDAVRMSMSYPFLFEPVTLYQAGKPHYIVDGGLLSNFPIWLFDSPNPMRPTWGFRLHGGMGPEQPPYHKVGRFSWQLPLTLAMFSSMMDAWDQWHRSKASGSRTVSIPTGPIKTTDFGLGDPDAQRLYGWGYDAARNFFASPAIRDYLNSFGQTPSAAIVPPTAAAHQ